jgi:3-hydroxyacyl-CoA dehydrogenase
LGWDTEAGFSQHVNSSEPLDSSVIELLKVAGQNPEIMSREELDFAHKFIDKYQKTGPPPAVPAPSYPTMQRNGQSGQQQQKGFSMAPISQQQVNIC